MDSHPTPVRPASRRLTGRLIAAAAVCATAVALAAPASAAGPAPRPATTRPAAVTGGSGATVPFTTYEAENGSTNGTVIGPDYTQGTVASEASGRKAVQLSGTGQYVQFTLTAPANAIDVTYNLPQGSSGSLAVYVNGTRISQTLPVTSKYSYVNTGNIVGSKTHHLFDDSRLLLGQNLAVGAKVKVQVDSDSTGGPFTIDMAQFEQVAAAASQPSGSVSPTTYGADPTGAADSTNAFNQAITAARSGGKVLWIPQGVFTISSPLQVDGLTVIGAGMWYSELHGTHLFDLSNPQGGVKLENFAAFGEVTTRNDSSPDNFVNGSLGANSVVSGIWVQHEKCGLWLTGNNTNLQVTGNRILDTTADGVNINGTATGAVVSNNYVRNTGDDGLAMWSLNAADSNDSFLNNTVIQPNLANGIALYGGSNLTVKGNYVQDTNALGSGIAISNQAFASPFFPLSGTITVDSNTIERGGALNPNWNHPMGALRVDSYDYAITNPVNITNTVIKDSPYSAFEFVSGSGTGNAISGVTVNGATVTNSGTVVVQNETKGSATFSNVTATGVGAAGIYNCPYPTGTGTFSVVDGGGNSGWSSTWNDCTTWPTPNGGNPGGGGTPPGTGNLALNKTVTDTGHQDVYVASNAVDGNANTYWESADNAFPASFTVDLGSAQPVGRLVLKLPPSTSWGARTQTLSVLDSTDNSSYSTVVASKGYTFDPNNGGNSVTITLPSGTSTRYLRLTFTANTAWSAGQLSEFEAYAS
ncbi:discoidin domain-containing protein [Streptantibioticus silvisoli]|uniref:Discoidin domain-containing protein n=1 Tax=Streptantibioticus silvisoli TaxID=2705255 RepID=A0ABT6W6D1_9ACTN|nr:discoidin domain-containing protein [Streptantibioticus silvisoli]MDI5965950.1 discoidin domain-containing protein [Streptantibioticus silvisoli]